MRAVVEADAVARHHAREHASLLRELRVARARVADLEASRVLEAGMSSARPTEEATP
jgi:post-segregation antitoxin (ccd killing protein)